MGNYKYYDAMLSTEIDLLGDVHVRSILRQPLSNKEKRKKIEANFRLIDSLKAKKLLNYLLIKFF